MKQATTTYPSQKEVTPSKTNRETTANISRIDEVSTPAIQNPSSSYSSSTSRLSSTSGSSSTPEKSIFNNSRESIDQGVADQERIRQRAYELYAQSGYRDGRAEEDWFEAERELQQQRKS